jgi:hypothetical protein
MQTLTVVETKSEGSLWEAKLEHPEGITTSTSPVTTTISPSSERILSNSERNQEQSSSAPERLTTQTINTHHVIPQQRPSKLSTHVHFYPIHSSVTTPSLRDTRFHNQIHHRHDTLDTYEFRISKRRKNSPQGNKSQHTHSMKQNNNLNSTTL